MISGKTATPTAFRQVIGTAQLPTRLVQAASSSEIKQPGREGDRTFPSRVEVKNEWSSTLSLFYIYIFDMRCGAKCTSDLPTPSLVFCSTLLIFI